MSKELEKIKCYADYFTKKLCIMYFWILVVTMFFIWPIYLNNFADAYIKASRFRIEVKEQEEKRTVLANKIKIRQYEAESKRIRYVAEIKAKQIVAEKKAEIAEKHRIAMANRKLASATVTLKDGRKKHFKWFLKNGQEQCKITYSGQPQKQIQVELEQHKQPTKTFKVGSSSKINFKIRRYSELIK